MMSSRGSGPALLGELLGVHEHLDLGLEHLLLGHRVLGVLGADHAVAPLEDLVAVLARHADELGDHLEGQLGGDVDDEVALALRRAPRRGCWSVSSRMCGSSWPIIRGREAAVDELAVPGVVRRVHEEHEVAAGLPPPRSGHADSLLEADDAASRRVGGEGAGVAVARDDVGVLA